LLGGDRPNLCANGACDAHRNRAPDHDAHRSARHVCRASTRHDRTGGRKKNQRDARNNGHSRVIRALVRLVQLDEFAPRARCAAAGSRCARGIDRAIRAMGTPFVLLRSRPHALRYVAMLKASCVNDAAAEPLNRDKSSDLPRTLHEAGISFVVRPG
jgi:hypothetical protein